MQAIFQSENIDFVHVSELYLQDYLAMINDPETGKYIGIKAPISEQQERDFIRKHLENNDPIFSMIERKSGEFIGNIELSPLDDGQGELGICITPKKQNSGYGQESIRRFIDYCSKALNQKRIILKVYPDNCRAIHVYKNCGFKEYDRRDDDIFMEINL